MSAEASRLPDYLGHILEAIQRIEAYVEGTDQAEFLRSEMIQDAVIRNLEVIGEASHNIETRYPDFAQEHPDIPLAYAYQMRNAVAHGYFKVDLGIDWNTIQKDLPRLRQQVNEALGALD